MSLTSIITVQFCPTVGESLFASGQPIPRQRKIIILSSVPFGEFLYDIESVREGNPVFGSLSICTPLLGR